MHDITLNGLPGLQQRLSPVGYLTAGMIPAYRRMEAERPPGAAFQQNIQSIFPPAGAIASLTILLIFVAIVCWAVVIGINAIPLTAETDFAGDMLDVVTFEGAVLVEEPLFQLEETVPVRPFWWSTVGDVQ